jgi:heme/copper-type cytochrome/quinol oxidase subunit 2
MNKKIIIPIVIIGIIVTIAIIAINKTAKQVSETEIVPITENSIRDNITENIFPVAQKQESEERAVKEFVMKSYTNMVDGKPAPRFSLDTITVNKGDLVRLKINTISGRHNFKIDEFGVFADTPIDEETVVEFTADKVGEFVYYCNMPGHRANGHWGTLKVLE